MKPFLHVVATLGFLSYGVYNYFNTSSEHQADISERGLNPGQLRLSKVLPSLPRNTSTRSLDHLQEDLMVRPKKRAYNLTISADSPGLGNKIFEVASLVGIAVKNGMNVVLPPRLGPAEREHEAGSHQAVSHQNGGQ
jgi:hypothetical protein